MVGISVLTVFFSPRKRRKVVSNSVFIIIFMCSKLEFYLELFSQSMHWKHTCNLLKATGIITANETSSYRSTISISSRWWRFCLLVVQEQSGNSVVDFFSPSHLPFKRMFTFSDLSNPPSSGCLLSEILLITAFRAQFILQYGVL